jgi:hypothetical protein
LPEIHDRVNLRQSRDQNIYAETPFGPILQFVDVVAKDDSIKQIPVANPFAALWTAATTCDPFRVFLRNKLLQKPPTFEEPWRLVLYSDEVTPGNPLGTNNKRKFHAIYWSFLELGASALSREESWFCTLSEYSTVINSIHAGLSQAFSAIIKLFFSSDGFNFETVGINLPFDTNDIRLFAKLGVIIQDGGAHKSVWSSRGDAASKYCLLCKNLFTESSRMCGEDGSSLLTCHATKLDQLVPASDDDLRRNARFIAGQAHIMNNEAFTQLQQSLGMTHHPHALLLDRSLDWLKPTEIYMHDWMHALFVDGVVNAIVVLLFGAFIKKGMNKIYTTFSEYLEKWKFPVRIHGDHLAEIFEESRAKKHRKAQHIKCQASDLLSITTVLAIFVQTVLIPLHMCDAECMAFLAVADLVDIILSTSRNEVPAAVLLARVHCFLDKFVHAFGYDWMTPKFHWLLHLAEALQRLGLLLNCFVLERKHRIAKRYATDLANTSSNPSISLLSEIQSHHLGQLREPGVFNFEVGLVGGRKASHVLRRRILEALDASQMEIGEIQVGRESRHNRFGTCCTGDVVLLKHGESFRAARVELHCEVVGEPLSILTCFKLISHKADTGYAVWAVDESEMHFTTDIIDTVPHSKLPNGLIMTSLPVDYR